MSKGCNLRGKGTVVSSMFRSNHLLHSSIPSLPHLAVNEVLVRDLNPNRKSRNQRSSFLQYQYYTTSTEKKSCLDSTLSTTRSVSAQGCEQEWNETFVFSVSDRANYKELVVKIMDKDTFSQDDFVSQATIPIRPVFLEGKIRPTAYNVVKEQEYRGEIRLDLTFTPQIPTVDGRNPLTPTDLMFCVSHLVFWD